MANGPAFAADPVRALEPARQPLHRAFGGETFPPVHLVHRCERSAADIPVSVSGMPLRDREGNLNGAMLVLHETGNAPPMSHELAHLIQHDSLTGVANREMFLDLGSSLHPTCAKRSAKPGRRWRTKKASSTGRSSTIAR